MKSGTSSSMGHHKNQSETNISVSSATVGIASTDTFIVVKHGDNFDKIFNSNCKVQNLLENIKQRCRVKDKVVDLSDLSGNMVNLRDEALKLKYAHNFVKPRQTLVLIEVKASREPHSAVTYAPLLDNKDIVNENFMLKLLPKVVQAAKRGSNSKASVSSSRSNGGRNSVNSAHPTVSTTNAETTPKSRSNSLLKEKDESPVVSNSRRKSVIFSPDKKRN